MFLHPNGLYLDAAASPALGSRLLTVEDVAAQLGVSEASVPAPAGHWIATEPFSADI